MKQALAIVLTTSLLFAGCASTETKDDAAMASVTTPAITQAKADLDTAIKAGAQWRIIDKSTGSKAVDLTKLLAVAEKKAEAGEMDEANRIAARVSKASNIAVGQQKRYAGTMPYYN